MLWAASPQQREQIHEEDKQLALLLRLALTCFLKVQLLSLQKLGFH